MTKHDVKSWEDLKLFARQRVAGSVKRNDPVAAAYWTSTLKFAHECAGLEISPDAMVARAKYWGLEAAKRDWESDPFKAAALYSRAKWCVIIGRNLGFVMSYKKMDLGIHWLRQAAARCMPV